MSPTSSGRVPCIDRQLEQLVTLGVFSQKRKTSLRPSKRACSGILVCAPLSMLCDAVDVGSRFMQHHENDLHMETVSDLFIK